MIIIVRDSYDNSVVGYYQGDRELKNKLLELNNKWHEDCIDYSLEEYISENIEKDNILNKSDVIEMRI